MQTDHVCFGPFRLDCTNHCLWREDVAIPLVPKTFAILHHLVTHAGRLLTKEELLDALWPGEYVSDAVLKVRIGELRKILGDHAKAPQYIETVHRRGYRFIAPLSHATAAVQPLPLSTLHDSSPSSFSPPLIVGRETALSHLYGCFDRARQGTRQVVFITGEAGIGKTILVETFLAQLAAQGSAWISRGQCVEHHGPGEAYLPILEALGRLCQGSHREHLIPLLRRYAPMWLIQLPAVLSLEERHTLQREVLGATRERMLRELTEVLERLTAERPLILVLEDLHWSDPSTLDVITMLARRRETARLLLLGTYRPADVHLYAHPMKGVKEELALHEHCQELPLAFLTEAEVRAYLQARFDGSLEDVVAELAQALHRRTDGNPLFLVNGIDALMAQGVLVQHGPAWRVHGAQDAIALGVPENLQQLIVYQFERLNQDEQRLLEVASVVGEEFSTAAVAAALSGDADMIEAWCDRLVRREQFLHAHDVEEWPDGTLAGRYRFAHGLYREVLYHRMSAPQRVRCHQRIGRCLEAAYTRQPSVIAAELALHFEHGRRYVEAIRYRRLAGQTAMERHAYREAIAHLTQGQHLLPWLQESQDRMQHELLLQLPLGAALLMTVGQAAPEVERAYARAYELCQQVDETPQLVPVLLGLWRFYLVRAALEQAQALGEQLLGLVQRLQDHTGLVLAHYTMGVTLFWLGDVAPACSQLEAGSALYAPHQHRALAFQSGQDPGVACLAFTARALWILGYPDRALQRSQEALTCAEQLEHAFSRAFALTFVGYIYQLRREWQTAQDLAEAVVALATEQQFPFWVALATVQRGCAQAAQGQPEAGLVQIQQGVHSWQVTGAGLGEPYFLGLLAEIYGYLGRHDEGVHLLNQALGVIGTTGERWYEAELHRLKGEFVLRQAEQGRTGIRHTVATAEASLLQALDVARCQQAKSWELRAALSLGRLWQHRGQRHDAYQVVAKVYEWFTEGFDTADLLEAKALLDTLA